MSDGFTQSIQPRSRIELVDELLGLWWFRLIVESPAQLGRTKALIHPGTNTNAKSPSTQPGEKPGIALAQRLLSWLLHKTPMCRLKLELSYRQFMTTVKRG